MSATLVACAGHGSSSLVFTSSGNSDIGWETHILMHQNQQSAKVAAHRSQAAHRSIISSGPIEALWGYRVHHQLSLHHVLMPGNRRPKVVGVLLVSLLAEPRFWCVHAGLMGNMHVVSCINDTIAQAVVCSFWRVAGLLMLQFCCADADVCVEYLLWACVSAKAVRHISL